MKKYFYMAVAAIAVLSSCDKENAILHDNGNGVSNAGAPVFTATIEPTTKTTLVEGSTAGKKKVEWLSTDQVFIYGYDNNEDFNPSVIGTYTATPGTPATTATLNPGTLKINNSSVTAGGYTAIYPASIAYLNSKTVDEITDDISTYGADGLHNIFGFFIQLPETQKYNGTDISQIAPMFAYSNSTSLEFKNLTALLAITVKAEDFTSVSSIKVSTDVEKTLSGVYVIERYNVEVIPAEAIPDGFGTKYAYVTLDCQNAGTNTTIPSGESKTFYVSIPPETYPYLQIEVTDGTKTKTMKTKAASITVARNMIYPITFKDNQTPAHAYVDLGLSVKWATMNVGATTIVGYGDYFAWGATEPLYEAGYAQENPQAHWKAGKSSGYCFNNTPYQTVNTTNDSSTKWTKYLGSTTSSYKNSSATRDDLLKTVLDAGDDAARANWGGNWRMPTREEWAELINSSNCKWTWTTQEGIKGYKVQSKKAGYTDNWIFLPAAGQRINTRLDYLGSYCNYWSSSLYESDPCAAGSFEGNEYNHEVCDYNRLCGFSVRPVCE